MQTSKYNTKSLMDIINRPDLIFVKGHNSWLEDADGKSYLDFMQGWAVNVLGHCPNEIKETIHKQSELLINPSPAFYNLPSIQLSSKLVSSSCFDKVFFANSGAEANEGAIKLARKWGQIKKNGAYKIITMHNSFHGRTLATMSASGKQGWDKKFAPQVDGFYKATLNNIESVIDLIDNETVAIMLELVQGEAGVILADKLFVRELRKISQEKNILLIVDEVQTGMGRTGSLFAYQQFNIEPDIMTLGKGIGGGVPLSALLCKKNISVFEYGDQGGTYNGNPLCTAVGVTIIDILNSPNFLNSVNLKADKLSLELNLLANRLNLRGERGLGMLRALILNEYDDGPKIVEMARNYNPQGLLINSPRKDLIRFMPALNITEDEINIMINILEKVIIESRL
ncbi:Acetylornithine aminotransferase [Candidatus Kinetoplastibacterium sorsogonicusi]|uniref:Diaminobutyrate--2-oxoglutarate transaminase n=1 Tax=Candidatus Kinetoplastidibacterium kentomonadis TaxID=1576550 RepID=A0A3Q8ER47_9PROT|nr:acetylornithine transaminase [Candidatus Kinetoplastibacterium sorsogonicusi]AWD32152.1 Acetylornithine aminotransferase [Candidatus Kinetoplastibacterium sorsogonicusi]